jgi:transposase-like protein
VKPTRRRFNAEYKLRILREAERCRESGELGALLRREGLYSSHLAAWRKQARIGLADEKRGRKPKRSGSERRRIEQLERENRALRRRLEQAETIISVQKKLSLILESMGTEDSGKSDGNS